MRRIRRRLLQGVCEQPVRQAHGAQAFRADFGRAWDRRESDESYFTIRRGAGGPERTVRVPDRDQGGDEETEADRPHDPPAPGD
jgi:hypothetical protein